MINLSVWYGFPVKYPIRPNNGLPQGLHHLLGFPDLPPCRSGLHSEYFCLLAKFGTPAATECSQIPNNLLQKSYLEKHESQSEVLQSFIPTLLVSVLTILIPQLLLLIAKRGHTIVTLSTLHDLVMTRYYKFLVVNLVVFFCIGESALVSIKNFTHWNVVTTTINSFPNAAPFYVGWCKPSLIFL